MIRVAVVTGAAGGIGRATVRAFVEAGWRVVGTDLTDPSDRGGAECFLAVDLSGPEAANQVIGAVVQEAGRLDALVNNAAVEVCKPVPEMTVAEWDMTMAINVRAPFLLAKAAYPLLQASHGSVVNVSSVHAVATSEQMSAYAASKGALVALTRALAIEFAPAEIRVNAVLPGAVDTNMLRVGIRRGTTRGRTEEEVIAALAARTALRRIGQPEEIADAIVFLADPTHAAFITGQILTVDGGATARLSTEDLRE